jgi:hypothetical protein
MNRNVTFVLGVAVSGLAAYGIYRATRGFPWDSTGRGDADRAVTEASPLTRSAGRTSTGRRSPRPQ